MIQDKELRMQRVPCDRYTFAFAADGEPVLEVAAGEQVVFEILDSSAGRLQQPEDIHRLKPDFVGRTLPLDPSSCEAPNPEMPSRSTSCRSRPTRL
jgi:hypothetical protein